MLIRRHHHQALRLERQRRLAGAQPGLVQATQNQIAAIDAIDLRAVLPDIPRNRWPELIRAQAAENLHTLSADGPPIHDQGNTNYCWAHGPTRALELLILYETGVQIALAAESVAVPLTGGHNIGGNPEAAIQQLQQKGACIRTLWKPNSLDPRCASPKWEADAKAHRILRWARVPTWNSQITAALHQLPVAIALSWWSHCVCQSGVDLDANQETIIWFDNSWGAQWHEEGRSQLDEQSGTADMGAYVALTAEMLSEGIKSPIGL